MCVLVNVCVQSLVPTLVLLMIAYSSMAKTRSKKAEHPDSKAKGDGHFDKNWIKEFHTETELKSGCGMGVASSPV